MTPQMDNEMVIRRKGFAALVALKITGVLWKRARELNERTVKSMVRWEVERTVFLKADLMDYGHVCVPDCLRSKSLFAYRTADRRCWKRHRFTCWWLGWFRIADGWLLTRLARSKFWGSSLMNRKGDLKRTETKKGPRKVAIWVSEKCKQTRVTEMNRFKSSIFVKIAFFGEHSVSKSGNLFV